MKTPTKVGRYQTPTAEFRFYDCTTLAFATEREHDQADEEKGRRLAKGFSKDGRYHRSQVLLALMVTSEGLPVGYELFPGNTWEVHTLKVACKILQWPLRRWKSDSISP